VLTELTGVIIGRDCARQGW